MSTTSATITQKAKFWTAKSNLLHTPQPTKAELIKLSTVNGSGIYLPPSPSDENNRNEDYFTHFKTQDNFHIPRCDKLTHQRNFYTPSSYTVTK
jgi:hypothetical protein